MAARGAPPRGASAGRLIARLSRDEGAPDTFGGSLAESIMSERSYRSTVLASALVWFLLGLHSPVLHQITHHNRMPDTTVLVVMVVLAILGRRLCPSPCGAPRDSVAGQDRTNDGGTLSAPCPALGFVVDLEPASASPPIDSRACARSGLRSSMRVGCEGASCRRARRSASRSRARRRRRPRTTAPLAEGWLATRAEVSPLAGGRHRDLRPDS